MSDLGRQEFEGWMQLIREDIRGVHSRLDTINGRVRNTETEIAVLKDRGTEKTKDPAARWGAAGAIVAGALTALYQWVSKP